MSIFPVSNSILSPQAIALWIMERDELETPLTCRFFLQGLNDTYLLTAGADRSIFRVYQAGWRSDDDVYWEMDLLGHLGRKGVAVSLPVPARDTRLIHVLEAPEGARQAALFSYAPGTFPSTKDQAWSRLYGRAIAWLHNATDDFASTYSRFSLDLDHLLTAPLAALQPFLVHRQDDWKYLLEHGRAVASGIQDRAPDLEWGICHGDLHGENAHFEGQNVTFFDFDCGGPGWRAYELAVFRWSLEHRQPDQADSLWRAYLDGYTTTRTLRSADLDAVPLFVTLRQIWLMGLQASNSNDWGISFMDDSYFDSALEFLRTWQGEHPV